MSALVKLKRILLTGFEPFHSASLNPSKELVDRIAHPAIVAKAILPVVFGESAKQLCQLIDRHNPDVVISLGQAEGRREISVERVALNLDDARIADNDGNIPVDQTIERDGPDAYFATLPAKDLVDALRKGGVAANLSLSAGSFVCNHIFYAGLHHCRDRQVLAGFIHLPLMTEQAGEFPGIPTMELSEMMKGVNLVLEYLAS